MSCEVNTAILNIIDDENWGSDKLNNLPKITQKGAEIVKTQVWGTPKLKLSAIYYAAPQRNPGFIYLKQE